MWLQATVADMSRAVGECHVPALFFDQPQCAISQSFGARPYSLHRYLWQTTVSRVRRSRAFGKGQGNVMIGADIGLVQEGFKVLHIIGLCIGLGGTALADLLVIQALMSFAGPDVATYHRRIHRPAIGGLTLVWISGIGLVALEHDWRALPQPVLVKLALSAILVINLSIIGKRFLSTLAEGPQQTRSLIPWGRTLELAGLVGISITAWFSALFVAKLSSFREMDLQMTLLLIAGFLALTLSALAGFIVMARMATFFRRLFGSRGRHGGSGDTYRFRRRTALCRGARRR